MEIVRVTNNYDLALARRGLLLLSQVRTIEVQAHVDPSATKLVLPSDVVDQLGLPVAGYRNVHYEADQVEAMPWVVGVKIEIRGRETVVSALVGPAGSPPVIGREPIGEMDFVVDPSTGELRPNPDPPDARKQDRSDPT